MPMETERKSASWLDDLDLSYQIREAHDLLQEVTDPWLAKYGLILQAEFRARGYKVACDPRALMDHLGRCEPTKPRWIRAFHSAHRGHFVTLGWIRYLTERGADKKVIFARLHNDPHVTLRGFLSLESSLTTPESVRPYYDKTELPGIYRLSP